MMLAQVPASVDKTVIAKLTLLASIQGVAVKASASSLFRQKARLSSVEALTLRLNQH